MRRRRWKMLRAAAHRREAKCLPYRTGSTPVKPFSNDL